jgi:hypothetical protein
MNRYHRHLNLPNCKPNIDINQWDTNNSSWVQFHKTLELQDLNNQNLLDLLKSLDMTSYWIEVFCTPPNDVGVIHSDNTEWDDWAKIVFQYGAEGSTMRWWTSENIHNISTNLIDISEEQIPGINQVRGGDRSDDHYHGRILISYEHDSTLQYEAEIGDSSLVNVGPLHSSYNSTNEKRITLTVALFTPEGNRVLWDDALERLKSYVK